MTLSVIGFEDMYEIDDKLNVFSKERLSEERGGYLVPRKQLKTEYKGKDGYVSLGIGKDRRRYSVEKIYYCSKNNIELKEKITIFDIRKSKGEPKKKIPIQNTETQNKKQIIIDNILEYSKKKNKPIRRITLQDFFNYIQTKYEKN